MISKIFVDGLRSLSAFEREFGPGITVVHGPLGYNDLDKEGLLVEGFEYDETYGGVYNEPYYLPHLGKLGFKKEFDWVERLIEVGDKVDERYDRTADYIAKRFRFSEMVSDRMSTGEVISRYADGIFRLIDEA